MWHTHITTSNPDATVTVVVPAWHLTTDGNHAATVYDQRIMLDWLATGRADSAEMGYVHRHPQHPITLAGPAS
jgi:hypothetical protein